jgi:hypothetical protein
MSSIVQIVRMLRDSGRASLPADPVARYDNRVIQHVNEVNLQDLGATRVP